MNTTHVTAHPTSVELHRLTACPTTSRTTPSSHARRRWSVAGVAALSLAGIVGSLVAAPMPARADATAVEISAQPWSALGIRATADSSVTWLGDDRVVIAGGVELTLGSVPMPMPSDTVVLHQDAAGVWRLESGYATVATPKIGLLAGSSASRAPFARFGRATGSELRHLGAHLVDGSHYWYFQFDGSFMPDLPQLRALGLGSLVEAMGTSGGSGILVIEEQGRYAYVGGECPSLPTNLAKNAITKGSSNVSKARRAAATPRRTAAMTAAAAQRKQLQERIETAQDVVEAISESLGDDLFPLAADPTDVDGPECGFGVSFADAIPGTDLQGRPFGASIVVDGVMAVNPFLQIDGTVLIATGVDRFVVQAAGDIAATVPLADVQLPLGDAAAQISVDRTGTRLTGTAALAVPGVDIRGKAIVDLLVGAEHQQSFFHADAAISVGKTALANARIDVDRTGLTITGGARLGAVDVTLKGSVGTKGVDLSGTGTAQFHSLNDVFVKATEADIRTTKTSITSIDRRLSTARATVRDEKLQASQDLKNLRATVVAENRKLDASAVAIARENDAIASNRRLIRNENDWYNRLPIWRMAAESIGHGARLLGYEAAITASHSSIALQTGYRDTARFVLTNAEQAIKNMEASIRKSNVDKDFRVAPIVNERTEASNRLKTLETQLQSLKTASTVKGTIHLHAGSSGIDGSITVEQCSGARCTPVAGARLVITPAPQACVLLPGVPEACVKL